MTEKMFSCRPRRRRRKPPIYPKRKSKEELRIEYEKWKAENPSIDEFSDDEKKMYYEEGKCISMVINYRLHGIYDRWACNNPNIKEFSEKEFDDFLDRGVSIEEIINRRPEHEKYKKTTITPQIHISEEFGYYIESLTEESEEDDVRLHYYIPDDDADISMELSDST